MYRKLTHAAATAAAVAAMSFIAAPADASPYRVVRWEPTRVCQIWDYGVSVPWGLYTVMSKPKATFHAALRAEHRLVRQRRCGW